MALDEEAVDTALDLLADKHVNRMDGNSEEEDSDNRLVVQGALAASVGNEVEGVADSADHIHMVEVGGHIPCLGLLGEDTGFPLDKDKMIYHKIHLLIG